MKLISVSPLNSTLILQYKLWDLINLQLVEKAYVHMYAVRNETEPFLRIHWHFDVSHELHFMPNGKQKKMISSD
jgi:hypothetical protein